MASEPIFPDVAPWPTQTVAPVPRTHNNPPPEEVIPAEFREVLLAERPDFLQKLDDLLGFDDAEGSVHRAICIDEDTFAKCASLIGILRACEKHVDGTHKIVKEPFLIGGKIVDGQKNVLQDRIIAGRQIVEGKQQKYVREQRRLAEERRAEEAAQRQREEEERQRLADLARENGLENALPVAPPAPPPPAPEPVKSAPIRADDGATVSTTVVMVPRVTDYARAFKHVKADAKVREAIDAAIARYVKATKATELAGVEFYEDIRVNNR